MIINMVDKYKTDIGIENHKYWGDCLPSVRITKVDSREIEQGANFLTTHIKSLKTIYKKKVATMHT